MEAGVAAGRVHLGREPSEVGPERVAQVLPVELGRRVHIPTVLGGRTRPAPVHAVVFVTSSRCVTAGRTPTGAIRTLEGLGGAAGSDGARGELLRSTSSSRAGRSATWGTPTRSPGADTGLTGRKIIVDTCGGAAPHGGGAFSGKDPTKVDRSAAYAARWLAKNVVSAGIADRCLVQLAYAIGVAKPVSVTVNTFGTMPENDSDIGRALQRTVGLSPRGLRERLGLDRPIYARTAAYGHFGRAPDADGGFSWERTDIGEAIIDELA
jgi:hypothetical protein